MEHAGKIANQITGKVIGKRKYEALKALDLENITDETLEAFNLQFNDLTVGEAIKLIKAYEEMFTHATGNSAKKIGKYFDKINQPRPPKEKKLLTKEMLWEIFTKKYAEQNGKKYSRLDDSINNLKPLIYYFIGDLENFSKCENLSQLSEPSFSKGILIIGGYGNGKTSTMKALQASLAHSNVSFRTITANDAVQKFEGLTTQELKDNFWKEMTSGTLYFDDLLTEREANNYGKVNIFKEVLEKREYMKKRTYATCNFDDQFPNDIEKALEQFAVKYGSRVYDRIFKMFNIIEFKGKSFRK